jgi:anti-sigma regulatory factor (Ser/Thr protein kinase)
MPPIERTRANRRHGAHAVLTLELDASPASVRRARDAVVDMLEAHGCEPGLIDRIRLVVSELVTNAVVHAGTPIGLRCRLDVEPCRVRVEVTDARPNALPEVRDAEAGDSAGGWGLQFVSTIGERWGVARSEEHKTVWCDVSPEDPPPTPRSS